ncbi:SurA N-terminal domain-containing protein [Alicyclobacillus sp. SO9]|uniref:SurA N-terminal domain-containing protein n=1 Tax=Alicyclobacillus sp. SO9 TaxID=2665646 RepID=UPI0018E714DD|nr:SurA N-terminal domain-containing protein [Alicyclobacillus sp. SO9]QQE77560.1 SurA N-terminal domain-containing protein [Alicyclobacillus sp. SO9]
MKSRQDKTTDGSEAKQSRAAEKHPLVRQIPLWSAVAAAVGGAVVVGAAWGTTAFLSRTGNHVIAKVGSTTITQAELANKLESTGGTQTLQQMIDNQLIKDGAKKYHLTATKAEVQSALSGMEAQYGISTTSELTSFLQQNHIQLNQLTAALKLQVLEQKLAERNVKVTNSEIQSYYNANKSQFTTTGQSKPQPLSKVKSQVVTAVKQSKAIPQSVLFSQLAKSDGLSILDSKYKSLNSQYSGTSTVGTGNVTGLAPSANSTNATGTGSASASNSSSAGASSTSSSNSTKNSAS